MPGAQTVSFSALAEVGEQRKLSLIEEHAGEPTAYARLLDDAMAVDGALFTAGGGWDNPGPAPAPETRG